jgi:hypothetical protein
MYPKVKYHPRLGIKTIESAQEEAALGLGWANSPNKFRKRSRLSKLLKDLQPVWIQSEWAVKTMALILAAQKLFKL